MSYNNGGWLAYLNSWILVCCYKGYLSSSLLPWKKKVYLYGVKKIHKGMKKASNVNNEMIGACMMKK